MDTNNNPSHLNIKKNWSGLQSPLLDGFTDQMLMYRYHRLEAISWSTYVPLSDHCMCQCDVMVFRAGIHIAPIEDDKQKLY